MIIVDNISQVFEGKLILNQVSISLDINKLYLLEGGNGSGKTTFLQILTDLMKPTSGEVSFKGEKSSQEELFQYFGVFIGNNSLIPFVTAEEYFELINSLRGNATDLDKFYADLRPFFNNEILGKSKPLAKFSSGNKSKVGIAAAFIGNPEFVVLDEPFAHLDANANTELQKLLQSRYWNKKGGGIISCHVSDVSPLLFDQALTLNEGSIK